MAIIRVKGILTEAGEIKVDLPENWQPGEVDIFLKANEIAWTDEELAELEALMQSQPASGSEIVASAEIGSWADMGDSVEIVEQIRQKRRESNQW